MALDHARAFDFDFALRRQHFQHAATPAFVAPGNDRHLIVLLDLGALCSCHLLNHLRRERNDLHKVLVAQLARYWSKHARTDRRPVLLDQHRRVLIESHVRPISAAHFLTRAHDHCILNGTFFNRAIRRSLFDRHLDAVSQTGNLSGGAADWHDHLHASCPRIVSNLQRGLHLDHCRYLRLSLRSLLRRFLNDLNYTPTLARGKWTRFHDSHLVAHCRTELVVGHELRRATHVAAIFPVPDQTVHTNHNGLRHLVRRDRTDLCRT